LNSPPGNVHEKTLLRRSRRFARLAAASAEAVTLRVSNQGDVQSMDPHSLNESLQLSFTGNVYESLIERDKKMGLAPGARHQVDADQPDRLALRPAPGVKFHDGTPFTADDVVFTFKRAAGDGSDMKGYTNPIKEVRKVGDLAVEIETTAPYPILPDTLTTLAMMSKKWCEDNKAEKPVDRRKGIENTASFKANGTGPVPPEGAPALGADRAGEELQLVGARPRAISTRSSSRRSATTRPASPRCSPARPT
jgi:peptide/nickel transport system substrate-binding protein